MRFFVLGNAERPNVRREADRLLPWLQKHGDVVVFDLEQKVDLAAYEADVALVLGGDGAILRAARQMGRKQIPVLGINLGKLGFLADVSPSEVPSVIPELLTGNYRVTTHLMFECEAETEDGLFECLGLNDVVVQSGPPFHMLELELAIHGELASRFFGDGLIVSTPVGSTAHGLSAGGPILGQELRAFVVTPICPHSLTSRTIVESADKIFTILVRRGSSSYLVVDGQDVRRLVTGGKVTIRQASVSFRLVKVAGRSYYRTLHDKLNWGATPNYQKDHEPPLSG
jgi:NAD+ kinase